MAKGLPAGLKNYLANKAKGTSAPNRMVMQPGMSSEKMDKAMDKKMGIPEKSAADKRKDKRGK